jgi:hypothetical protein
LRPGPGRGRGFEQDRRLGRPVRVEQAELALLGQDVLHGAVDQCQVDEARLDGVE